MKQLPTDDDVLGKGLVRPDGRKIHPTYLFDAKKPTESKRPWDYQFVTQSIPADESFRPMTEGNCPLIKP
jgi:branched-chain amino acid transport system substrate-binding protein